MAARPSTAADRSCRVTARPCLRSRRTRSRGAVPVRPTGPGSTTRRCFRGSEDGSRRHP